MNIVGQSISTQYGITERKKAELDKLTTKVLDAQSEVEQMQAIVTSLTEKTEKFDGFLNAADANRTQALSNYNLVDEVLQNSLDLMDNAEVAQSETGSAESAVKGLATEVNDVMKKLIYAAEYINKLANLVVRKKAINSLISDELVATMATAGTDANNAVALTLVALKSTFASQASGGEAEAAVTLTYIQAKSLHDVISPTGVAKVPNIMNQLTVAYDNAKTHYQLSKTANDEAANELKIAKSKLRKAEVKLKSLQSGLGAANAAAIAS